MDYKNKYLKYKNKYLELTKQLAGASLKKATDRAEKKADELKAKAIKLEQDNAWNTLFETEKYSAYVEMCILDAEMKTIVEVSRLNSVDVSRRSLLDDSLKIDSITDKFKNEIRENEDMKSEYYMISDKVREAMEILGLQPLVIPSIVQEDNDDFFI